MTYFGGGYPTPMLALPLGEYRKCTECGSLRGWVSVTANPTSAEDLLARISDPEMVVLCTKCARGRVDGMDKEWVAKSEPKIIPFWKHLKDPNFKIESLKIEGKEAMEDRGMSPYDCKVTINGEPVERLERIVLNVWVGEPGVLLNMFFAIHKFDEKGNVKDIESIVCDIGKDRIRSFEFDLVKTEEEKN